MPEISSQTITAPVRLQPGDRGLLNRFSFLLHLPQDANIVRAVHKNNPRTQIVGLLGDMRPDHVLIYTHGHTVSEHNRFWCDFDAWDIELVPFTYYPTLRILRNPGTDQDTRGL